MFWLISDTHFGHDNIIKYCNRPSNHDELMRENWIDNIDDKDIVVHLGDVFFRGTWHLNLPGEKYFIQGNHDSSKRVRELQSLGWILLEPFSIGNVIFSHYPLDTPFINIHGHMHQLDPTERHINISVERTEYKPVKLEDVLIMNQFIS